MKPLLIVMVWLGAMAGAASSESLTWHFRHEYPFAPNLALYSDNRNHVWPSGKRVWVLKSWEKQTITIECMRFERICYGAWSYTGRGNAYVYWGAGPSNRHRCSDCCYECNGGDTGEIVLRQGGALE